MRRIRIAAALLVLLVVVLGAAAAWWWRYKRVPPGAPMSSASDASSSSSQPPQSDAELILQVNGETTARITAGSSVFFTVTLMGAAPKPWSSDLRFETADGRPASFHIEPLGPTLTLRDSRMQRAGLGVAPDAAERIQTGTHAIRAVLAPAVGTSGGRLVSNTVTLTVERADSGQPLASDNARLQSSARFYLRAGKHEDARRLALQLVERGDQDPAAYILLADALNGLARDQEAFAAYQEALALLPRDPDEAPGYVIARMEQVQQRLEAAGAKKELPK